MTKAKNKAPTDETLTGAPEQPQYEIPAGYEDQSTEVVGFYSVQPEKQGALHWIPETVILTDNKKYSSDREPKISTLMIGRLLSPTVLWDRDGEPVQGEPGDKVGIWYMPGMAAIKVLAETKVFMHPNGERDTGKGNPLKLFKITSPTKGSILTVSADRRSRSKHVPPEFPVPRALQQTGAQSEPVDMSEVPF